MEASTDGTKVKQVKETMHGIYRAFEKLDARALDENFSHSDDLLAFGTDWDEKFAGWKMYKDVHTVQFAALKKFRSSGPWHGPPTGPTGRSRPRRGRRSRATSGSPRCSAGTRWRSDGSSGSGTSLRA